MSTAPLKPTIWYRCIDDTFVLCRHGRKNLDIFLDHLNKQHPDFNLAFLQNGYSQLDIKKAVGVGRAEKSESTMKAFLPFVPRVTDRIGRLLRKHNIRTVYNPTTMIPECLGSVKDRRPPLATAEIYRISCSCGSVYIGTTKRSVATIIEEHRQNCKLGHVEKSAVAEHALRDGTHNIYFGEAQVLATTTRYRPRLIREAEKKRQSR
ncbi:hypothetical protein YQE_01301, partial [Dendroctonus ponderosae]